MGACSSVKDIKSVVENFHLMAEKQFINHLESKMCTSYEGGSRVVSFAKLNDPINMYNDTVLHFAVFHNKSEICKYLIEKGANAHQQNKRNRSPYDLAKSKGYENIIKLIDSAKTK